MLTAWRGVTGMVVYWDLAALVNGAADYLLLLSAARLAGRTVPRLRLLGAAAFGAAYAVLRLVLPCSLRRSSGWRCSPSAARGRRSSWDC